MKLRFSVRSSKAMIWTVQFLYVPGTLGSPNFAEVPLNTAWNNLRNAVAKKVFTINVQFDKDVSFLSFSQYHSISRRYMT